MRIFRVCWHASTVCCINIAAQALGTEGEIGYVVTDVAQRPDQKALDQLASIEGTIRMRVIS